MPVSLHLNLGTCQLSAVSCQLLATWIPVQMMEWIRMEEIFQNWLYLSGLLMIRHDISFEAVLLLLDSGEYQSRDITYQQGDLHRWVTTGVHILDLNLFHIFVTKRHQRWELSKYIFLIVGFSGQTKQIYKYTSTQTPSTQFHDYTSTLLN